MPYHGRAQRWAALVAHRRCGKTVACVNDILPRALTLRRPKGRFAYVAPLLSQGKDIAWDYLKRYSEPIRIAEPNETELRVTILGDHQVRIYGADNPDRLRGGYLDGVVLDEFADMRPSVWGEVIRPMLSDRQGWATFIGTPRGRNEFHKICERARAADDWYFASLPASETGILPEDELESARLDMTAEQYAQEYECSFDAAILGAYYSREIAEAERRSRFVELERDRHVPVHAAWDLGIGDSTAIWIFQVLASEIHILDHYENSGLSLEHYAKVLDDQGWGDATNWLPHDAKARELGTGRTRVETLSAMGLRIAMVPDHTVEDGINALRLAIPLMWFNASSKGVLEGVEAWRQYRAEFDEKTRAFRNKPRHDWTSHTADAGRYMAMAWRSLRPQPKPEPKPIGKPLNKLTMDELIEMADRWEPDRSRV